MKVFAAMTLSARYKADASVRLGAKQSGLWWPMVGWTEGLNSFMQRGVGAWKLLGIQHPDIVLLFWSSGKQKTNAAAPNFAQIAGKDFR